MNQFFIAIVGFTIANFIWQASQPIPDWGVAIERSYFQALALGYFLAKSVFQT